MPETRDCPLGCPSTDDNVDLGLVPGDLGSRGGTSAGLPRWAGALPRWPAGSRDKAVQRLRSDAIDRRALESSSYLFPTRIARFLKVRDTTCTFPGCPRLARDCHSDHLVPWPQGPTTARNGSSECVHHHQAKHHYFAVTRAPAGGLTWTTPHSRSYTRPTRPLLRGW